MCLSSFSGCAASTEPEPDDRAPRSLVAAAPQASSSTGAAAATEPPLPPATPSFCLIPRTPPVLGEGACERRVEIRSLTASACFQGRISGTLRYACDGGAAILELGRRVLYGAFDGERLSVCGSDRFVLDERKVCSDGAERFSGLVGMEGPIDGPLDVRWEAVPLSRDPSCSYTTCEGAGTARVGALEP